MPSNGFIVLHRRLLDWEWYHDHNVTRLFIHLLLRANHAPKKWQGQTINRGQVLSGRIQLSSETGLSERTIRTCLNKLKTTSDLTIKTTNRYSIYTICNYDKWQNQEINRPAKRPATRHSSDQQPTTNNNDNNDNNKTIKRFSPPSINEVKEYCNERNNNINAQKFIDFYSSKGWMVGKNRMKDWKACIRTWESRDNTSQKTPFEIELEKLRRSKNA